MDAGQVGEYGSPKELLKNPKSLFSQLIAAEKLQERDGGFNKKDITVNKKKDIVEKIEMDKESRTLVPNSTKNVDTLINSTDASDSKRPVEILR